MKRAHALGLALSVSAGTACVVYQPVEQPNADGGSSGGSSGSLPRDCALVSGCYRSVLSYRGACSQQAQQEGLSYARISDQESFTQPNGCLEQGSVQSECVTRGLCEASGFSFESRIVDAESVQITLTYLFEGGSCQAVVDAERVEDSLCN